MPARAKTNKSKSVLSFFRESPSDFVFLAFRYYLGKMNIYSASFAEDLAKAWPHLNPVVQGLIKKELEEAFHTDDAQRLKSKGKTNVFRLGWNVDRKAWELVRHAYTYPAKQTPKSPKSTEPANIK